MSELHEFFGAVISTYTRAQAIEDGVLMDVSEVARDAGIWIPVAMTRGVFEKYVVPDGLARQWGQDEAGRLWDIVWMLRFAIRKAMNESRLEFIVRMVMKEKQKRDVQLKAIIGPGDDGEPVITIMLPDETED